MSMNDSQIEGVLFVIGNYKVVIESKFIKEIIEPKIVKPFPNPHPYIDGLFRERDKVHALINLPMLNVTDNKATSTNEKFVIIETDPGPFALRVSRVNKIIRFNRTDPSEQLSMDNTINKVVSGIYEVDHEPIYLIDPLKIFSEINETQALG